MPGQSLRNSYAKLQHDLSAEEPLVSRVARGTDTSTQFHDMHLAMEVGVVLSGRMLRQWVGHERSLGPGQVWLCGMWEPHGYRIDEAPFEVAVLLIHPDHLAGRGVGRTNFLPLFLSPPARRPQVPEHLLAEGIRIGRKLISLHRGNHRLGRDWQDAMLTELLLLLLESSPDLPSVRPGSTGQSYLRIQPALEMVFTRRGFIAVEDAAASCSLGPSRFDQLFKQVMGDTFARFALRHRVHGAAHQLAITDDPVKSVAYDWGFTDSSHLHAAMKRELGVTPSQYKAARRGPEPATRR